MDRGTWEVTGNYEIGWANPGNWQNYTRTIPEGAYQIWAAMSHADFGGEDVLRSTVSLVEGADSPDQTVTDIGKFSWPGSGGWSQNDIIPMLDETGAPVVVALSGETTLRWTMDNGDIDYLLLVPTGAAPAPSLAIGLQDGQVVLTWEGGATRQGADAVTGPYEDIADATSPYTTAPTEAAKFYRLKQ
jgi:predicted secreted protein